MGHLPLLQFELHKFMGTLHACRLSFQFISPCLICIYIYIDSDITLAPDSSSHLPLTTWVRQSAPLLAQTSRSTIGRGVSRQEAKEKGCTKNKAENKVENKRN